MTIPNDNTKERVVTLEVELRHINNKVDDLAEKVDEMHGVLMKAKGAQWALIATWVVIGAVLAKFSTILSYLK